VNRKKGLGESKLDERKGKGRKGRIEREKKINQLVGNDASWGIEIECTWRSSQSLN